MCEWYVCHVNYWRGFHFGAVLTIRLTAKLKSSPNFPTILYIGMVTEGSKYYIQCLEGGDTYATGFVIDKSKLG